MIGAFLAYRGKELPKGTGQAAGYKDAGNIAPWALPYVESMTAAGLFQGDAAGCFLPLGHATRGQAATVLIRLSNLESTLPNA